MNEVAGATRSGRGAVGSSVRRTDGRDKIRGRARFVADLQRPRMLHGSVLRSPHAHATISHLDVSAAASMPGVHAVITGADVRDLGNWGHLIRDRPVICTERVMFAGDVVAAVAAMDRATAEAAVLAINVEYDPLPVLSDVATALPSNARRLHPVTHPPGFLLPAERQQPGEGNVCYRWDDARGDVEAVFEAADVIVEDTYRFPAVYQYAMEPHAVIADHEGDRLSIWATCQHPFLVRLELAQLFGLRPGRVRVVVPYVGGGFGSKSYTKMEPVTVALSRAAQAPVRIVNTVSEAMATTRRHSMLCTMRTAATADGRLLAREATIWLDTGAYADNGPTVALVAGMAAPGPYRWEAVRVVSKCVYTNRPPAGSYRGFGAAHLQWIGESQVDRIARRVGIGQVEIRRRNLLRRGEVVRPGNRPLDADLIDDVERVAKAIGLDDTVGPDTGRGLAVGVMPGGAQPVSTARVHLDAHGHVHVHVGSTEIGQGARTVHAQVAAETLGTPLERITVYATDTDFTPFDRSTGASRSTTIAGLAVQRASQDLSQQVVEIAAAQLRVRPSTLRLSAGRVISATDSIDLGALVSTHFGMTGGELVGHGEVGRTSDEDLWIVPAFWEVAAAGVEIHLDRELGTVEVRRTATIADVGRAINPLLVERQDEGCTLQAIGNTLFEEMRFTHDGLLLNDTLLDYRIPTTRDLPWDMSSIIVENGDGPGPFGAKGCGEGVFGGMPAAIVNALGSAGVEVRELPASPHRLWRAMRDAGS